MIGIATWSFGDRVLRSLKKNYESGDSSIELVEKAVSDFEDDVTTGRYIVGRGGFPNAEGALECDAAIMDGCSNRFGAVAALKGISTPIRVARYVMEQCKHNFLVGEGALQFAKDTGFKQEDNSVLLGESSQDAHKDFLAKQKKPKSHDTLGLIVQDNSGNITVGVSSSGIAFKHPGRVGDSPLPGGGLYVDNDVGAACVTGDGDEILKYCPSYHVVHSMRTGASPAQACQSAVDIIHTKSPGCQIGVIAMNKNGKTGAATTIDKWKDDITGEIYPGFPYAVYSEGKVGPEIRIAKPCAN